MEIGSLSSGKFSPQIKSRIMVESVSEKRSVPTPAAQQIHSQGEEKQIDKKKLEEIINSMNQFLVPTQTSIRFELHEELQEYYVTVIDSETDEVVREIPPKKMLDLYASMKEFIGVLFDRKI
ncbi:flagellar protein FlaG [Calidifontibacillus erzurumensis]|uniref:Flagellar protein FlaG n=1 Tax=Calidifontibacillus erzurumensis TaxID=2741433 RepID=A0A8J8GHC2_9BACI|nr:flagellar protein FlaG [Calidifontibacillus erzurumensis]NSL51796.1 flagellar protein FlaG [Calidifontibacillus erzurumensis]